MKPYKPFDVRDRFKGFKPEEEKVSPATADAIKLLNEAWTLPPMRPRKGYSPIVKAKLLEEQIARDMFFGIGPLSYSMILPNGIQMGDPIFNEEDWKKIGPPECEHEPIDVGFSTPKMVCKKCDKDLK